ncbi:PhyR family response regulator anti-anti-sigma factor [Henriciella litoralis]|uniref:PhyR family response regulator anti-anti-sigma factor n=1 Tax=Henriciella litoralis TaxID=568102 RepID=UPI00146B918E|nr:response regulator [Henriciella litoralis]
MGAADNLERELPYLRRYARAVTGNGVQGDKIVESMLVSMLDNIPSDFSRIALFSSLDARFSMMNTGEVSSEIAALSTDARRALMLTAMEGFPLNDAASIMRKNSDELLELIADAENDLTESLASKVFIIEDEPLVAAHIAQIARQVGHTVIGQAVTREEAVRACAELRPELILADVQLADGSSGADAVASIKENLDVPVIFITAFPQKLLTGRHGEPAYLIPKPFRPDMVKAVMSQALIQRRVRHSAKK